MISCTFFCWSKENEILFPYTYISSYSLSMHISTSSFFAKGEKERGTTYLQRKREKHGFLLWFSSLLFSFILLFSFLFLSCSKNLQKNIMLKYALQRIQMAIYKKYTYFLIKRYCIYHLLYLPLLLKGSRIVNADGQSTPACRAMANAVTTDYM